MKKYLLAAAAIAVFSTPAMAQERPRSDNPMNSMLTGAYVGVLGGYTMSDIDTGVGNAEPDGGDYGIFVGYKLDQYLERSIGVNGAIEAHYAWSDSEDTVAGIDIEKNNEWGVSFRPGISISDTINPYGIIGYKQAEYEASAGAISGDETYDGFELGLGTELVTMGDYGLRAEYAHTWYGEEDGIDVDEDTLRMGLAYHF